VRTLRVEQVPDDLYERIEDASSRRGVSLRDYVLELLSHAVGQGEAEARVSLLELEGLGREIWEGVDVEAYVAAERDSWDRE
jgi:hypothetical protein